MNTDFFRKEGPVAKHGNKVFNGVSAGLLVWIFATFATKEQFNDHARRCEGGAEKCELKRSKQWQKIADLELEIERVKLRSPRSPN